ncbi:MAG: hypothetical protein Kow0077_15890 [Anaerolineae bacterium]
MLHDIQALFDDGSQDDALELLEDYLAGSPDDLEAQFLKLKWSLDLKRNAQYVGETLARLSEACPDDTRIHDLRSRADKLVRDKLDEGRDDARRRYWRDARKCFDQAIAYSNGDAAIAMAAGLALYQASGGTDQPLDTLAQSGGRLLRAPRWEWPSETTEQAAEQYLSQAVENSGVGQTVHIEALQLRLFAALVKGRAEQALSLLADLEDAPEAYQALKRNVARVITALALERIRDLLRAGQVSVAQTLLAQCAPHLISLPDFSVVQMETLWQQNDLAGAVEACRNAVGLLESPLPQLTLSAARTVWEHVTGVELRCLRCDKPLAPTAEECGYCATPATRTKLLINQAFENQPPDAVALRIALAMLLAEQRAYREAVAALQDATTFLPGSHPILQKMRDLREGWPSIEEMPPDLSPADVEDWVTGGFASQATQQIYAICEHTPAAWEKLPRQSRLELVKALLDAGHHGLARMVLTRAFDASEPADDWLSLQSRLEQETQALAASCLREAEDALAIGRHQRAIDRASAALEAVPGHTDALLLRAAAYLQTEQDLLALRDYYAVINDETDTDVAVTARIGAAGVLERRFEFGPARALLDGIEHPEVECVRQRLARHQRSEPYVAVRRTTQVILQDTLAPAETTPYFHGFFGVILDAVSKPLGSNLEAWQSRIQVAGFEFLQVLGGLRHTLGEPIFALRIISQPDPDVAERGTLHIALLVRVSAQDEAQCRNLALNLWQILHSSLPMGQAGIYDFRPIVDEAALESLLEPFEIGGIAEIARREQSATMAGDRYAVIPFTSGTPDLHNLCWGLLRQKQPAMLSVQLQPTTLFPWERTVLEQVFTGQRVVNMARASSDSDGIALQDAGSRWWAESKSMLSAYVNRTLVDTVDTQAFVMQISVATSSPDIGLIPETVGAMLFGPATLRGGMATGGFEVIRAATPQELALARNNLVNLDIARWAYSAAPAEMPRQRYMVGDFEASLAFRLPVPGRDGIPGVRVIKARPVPPPPGLPEHGTVYGQSLARINGLPVRIVQSIDDRRRHMYVVGKTGTGKSTLLKNMALQDIEAGRGVCVIDPHGDLIEDILERLPEARIQDTIVFDPSDEQRPIGLNLLQAGTESDRQRIVNEFIGLLIRMYDPGTMGIVGPRFQHNVRNAMLTAMSVEGSTLIEVVRVLTDIDFTRKLLPYVKDPLVRNYWTKQIANTSDFHKSEILDYIVSKFSRFVGDSRVRNIIGQRETTLDFRRVMDQQQILLVNLSKGKIGPESAQFLGLLMIQGLLITALSRADLPPSQRPDFFIYVDEFQNFATDLFGVMLSEGRKYGIALTMANQYLTQLDHAIREAVFGNVGSLVAFRLGTADAAALAPEVYPTFNGEDLLNLPAFTACVKLLVNGTAARPFTMETLADTRPVDPGRAARIRAHSREAFGRDAETVSQDILTRFNL